jgi:nitrogen regulatory protein PII
MCMKLLIVLSIRESQDKVAELLERVGVSRFSTVSISGHKKRKENPLINWYGSNSELAKVSSVMLFSFTDEETAHKVLENINKCNEDAHDVFPAHAFTLNVDEFSKFF